jgi:hypothetical protein
MNLHLAEIAAAVEPAGHAVLLVDQAGWHISTRLVVPANVTIITLPPKCPELNPVENVWQFMRDNWLSNRIFKSYDDLVDHCCEAWNKLVDQCPQGAIGWVLTGTFFSEATASRNSNHRLLSTTGLNSHPRRIGLADFRNLHGADIAKDTGSKIARHVMGDRGERLVVVPASDGKTQAPGM